MIFLFAISIAQSQTKEDIERIRQMQDSVMKQFNQIQDSMMNLSQHKKGVEEKKKPAVNKTTQQQKPGVDDWFWNNSWHTTRVSNNNVFPDWDSSTLTIAIGYSMEAQSKLEYFKVGMINPDGSIQINLPDTVLTKSSFENEFGEQGLFFDLNNNTAKKMKNEKTGFLTNTGFFVMQNEKVIGSLTMGNSVRVTHNLRDQSSLYAGDEGYLIYWAWANDSCSLQANEDWQGKVRRDGTNTIEVKTNVNYKLNFKPGWNLVKAAVIGKYKLAHERGLEMSWFKAHQHTIIELIPAEAVYYFRRNKF